MRLPDALEAFESELRTSPMRRCLAADMAAPIPMPPALAEIEQQQRTLAAKLVRPMNVVLMGEVKAGKSTLLNALAGAEVSPANVLEATAAIIDIYHAAEPEARILFKNGTARTGSPAEIHRLLTDHRSDTEFHAACDLVAIGLPQPNLMRFHLVDTPGLSSLTAENAARTRQFMQEADVVLWVFNASHLGQADVNDEVTATAELGKPVIGILNRIDEVDGDPQRLVRYLGRSLGIHLQAILPLSGYQALQAVLAGDAAQKAASGLVVMEQYLAEKIAIRSDEAHRESIANSFTALMRREAGLHRASQDAVAALLERAAQHRRETDEQVGLIGERLTHYIREAASTFLRAEFKQLEGEVKHLGALPSQTEMKRIADRAADLISRQGIGRWWEELSGQINAEFRREWQQAIETIQNRLEQEIAGFAERERAALQVGLENVGVAGLMAVTGAAFSGAALSTAVGAGFAGYAAWLGPAAASISIGPALAAVVPPVLIGGAVVGAIWGYFSGQRKKTELSRLLHQQEEQARRAVLEQFLEPVVLPAIRKENEEQGRRHHRRYLEALCPDWTVESLRDLDASLKAYCSRMEDLAARELALVW